MHAGSSKPFAENSLLLCGIELSMSYAHYYDDISAIVFKDWFENTFYKFTQRNESSGGDG